LRISKGTKHTYGPHEEDTRGSRHEIQVMSDEGMLLKSFDIREIVKDAGLKFLGRRVDV